MAAGFLFDASKIMLVIIVGAAGHPNLRKMTNASKLARTSF
jgi:hypothetical protein